MGLAQDVRNGEVAMRVNRALEIALIAASVICPACSASRLRQKVDAGNAEIQLANQAWQAARIRLDSMCPMRRKRWTTLLNLWNLTKKMIVTRAWRKTPMRQRLMIGIGVGCPPIKSSSPCITKNCASA